MSRAMISESQRPVFLFLLLELEASASNVCLIDFSNSKQKSSTETKNSISFCLKSGRFILVYVLDLQLIVYKKIIFLLAPPPFFKYFLSRT